MTEPEQTPRLRPAFARMKDIAARTWYRGSAFALRHPWRTVGVLPAALVLYVAALYPFTPSIGDVKKAKQEQPTVVLSADGKELAVFKRANRDWVKLEDISPFVVDALIATEDRRFYQHHGFDARRTAKALVNTVSGDRQGGSTITQQLARNLYPEDVGRSPTITRKVKELITAIKIEAVYSKQEILETYLNTVPFLYNAYGIEAAAQTYFDKPARQLDVSESATLVGMLKGTSYYNPVLNPERAVQRRNTVLAQLVKADKLPAAQFETLAKKPMKLDFERQPEFSGPAAHVAQSIKRWLIDWADRNDYNIYADGLVVRTSIDSRLQAAANEAVSRQGDVLQAVADVEWARSGKSFSADASTYVAQRAKVAPFDYFWASQKPLVATFIRESSEYKAARDGGASDEAALDKLRADTAFMAALKRDKTRVQAGFIAIDPGNGHVKAWVGSRDYEDDKFDHVAQARRQPGSTFKPFVYGAAFEAGARPTDTYVDQAVEIRVDANQVWRPGDMHGTTNAPMTLREGLVKSKNTITAQVMQQVGPSRVAQLARAMGVRQSALQEVPSLALGTSPVTLREMVAGYATIANGGNYIEPNVVLAVEDRDHKVLEEFQTGTREPTMSFDTAQTLIDVMRGVIDEGTAVGLRSRFGIGTGVDLAGKTGTTQNNTDGWFIAMHPQLVAGAWMGFNDNRVTMRSDYWGQGAHNALFVVGDFLKASLAARTIDAKATFSVPKDVTKGAPADPSLMGRVNDWWSSLFPASTAPVEQAALTPQAVSVDAQPQVQQVPQVPRNEPLEEVQPLRTSDGAMRASRPLDTTAMGAPPQRMPDAVVVAPAEPARLPAALPGVMSWSSAGGSTAATVSAATGSATGSATAGSAVMRGGADVSASVVSGSSQMRESITGLPAQATGSANAAALD